MSNKDFETWWHNEGSQPPKENEDLEEFTKRIARTAWENGAYKKNEDMLDAISYSLKTPSSFKLDNWFVEKLKNKHKEDGFVTLDVGEKDSDLSVSLFKFQPPVTQEEYDKYSQRALVIPDEQKEVKAYVITKGYNDSKTHTQFSVHSVFMDKRDADSEIKTLNQDKIDMIERSNMEAYIDGKPIGTVTSVKGLPDTDTFTQDKLEEAMFKSSMKYIILSNMRRKGFITEEFVSQHTVLVCNEEMFNSSPEDIKPYLEIDKNMPLNQIIAFLVNQPPIKYPNTS